MYFIAVFNLLHAIVHVYPESFKHCVNEQYNQQHECLRYLIINIVSSYICDLVCYVILCVVIIPSVSCALILHVADVQGSTTPNQFGCITKTWSKTTCFFRFFFSFFIFCHLQYLA